MRNFETELDRKGVTRLVKETQVVVREEVTVIKKTKQNQAFLAKTDAGWSWADLRDYVIDEIQKRNGAVERNALRESGIFKGFISRWGDKAPAIARYGFEMCDGIWANEPITITRFCKGADPYFATPISLRIVDTPTTGW